MGVEDNIKNEYKTRVPKGEGRSEILKSGEYRSNMSGYLKYAKESINREYAGEYAGLPEMALIIFAETYLKPLYALAYMVTHPTEDMEVIYKKANFAVGEEAVNRLLESRYAKKKLGLEKEEAKKYRKMEKLFGLSKLFKEIKKSTILFEAWYDYHGPKKIAEAHGLTVAEVQSQYQNKIEALEDLRKELEDSVLKFSEGKTNLVPTSINENKESELSIEYQPLEKVLEKGQKKKRK